MSIAGAAHEQLRGSLSREADELLSTIRGTGFTGWSTLGVAGGRAAITALKALAGEPEPVSRVENVSAYVDSGILVEGTSYVPTTTQAPAVMVYLHGGGWVLGDHTLVDSLVRRLANASGCAVLSLNYRLAPEHPYPAAVNDVCAAVKWLAANGAAHGLDPCRIAVGGDSSGANLAAAASLHLRDEGTPVMFQLLIHPALDCNYERDSYRRFGDGALSALSRDDIEWFHRQYVSQFDELKQPGVSPLRAETLQRLPRTLLIAAELDPLLDENVEFANRLEQAGVEVELQIYPGMFHGFCRMAGALPDARNALDHAASTLRFALGLTTRGPSGVSA